MAELADPAHQKAWYSRPDDWEVYFNRPYREYHQWLQDCGDEMLPMVLLELVRLSTSGPVAVDMYNMPPKLAMELTELNRIVFLITTPEQLVNDYYNRPDHRDIYDCIMRLRDPEAALANCNKTLAYGCRLYLDELYQTGLYYIMREADSTVERTLELVEKHFGIG